MNGINMTTAAFVAAMAMSGCASGPQTDGVKASGFGWNAEDATECLQKAIDSGATKLVIDRQAGDWIVRPIIVAATNLEIVVADGVTVKAKRGEFKSRSACLMKFTRCRDVVLRGEGSAKLEMWKQDYMDPKLYDFAEWRHTVSIVGGANITVKDLELRSSGGDGVYVRDNAKKVTLLNLKCIDHNRQGISLISCTDLYAKNCLFNDTYGAAPQCGIDLEPNKPSDKLTNVVFEDCVFDGNASSGIKFHLSPLNGKTEPISCVFRRCKCRNNKGSAFGVYGTAGKWVGKDGPGSVRGTILIEDCEGSGNRGPAIMYRNLVPDALKVTMRNCRFDTTGVRSAVSFSSDLAYDFAGVDFENVKITTDGEPRIAFAPLTGAGAVDCRGAITFVGKDGKETAIDVEAWAAKQPRNPELLKFETAAFDFRKLVPVKTGLLKKPASTGWIDRRFTFVQLTTEPGEYKLQIDVAPRQAKRVPKASYQLRDAAGTDLGRKELKVGKNEIVLKSRGKGVFRLEISCGGGKASVTSPYCGCGVIAVAPVPNFWKKGRRYFSVPGSAEEVRVQVKIDGDRAGALYNAAGEKVAERKAGESGNATFLGKRAKTAADEIWSVGFDDNLWLNYYRIGAPCLPIVSSDPDAVITTK